MSARRPAADTKSRIRRLLQRMNDLSDRSVEAEFAGRSDWAESRRKRAVELALRIGALAKRHGLGDWLDDLIQREEERADHPGTNDHQPGAR